MDVITRKEAKSQGLTHYYTGKQCSRGHIAIRYVSTGQCQVCSYNHRKDWHYRHHEKSLASSRTFKKNNRSLIYAINANRRAYTRNATPLWSETDKIRVVYEKAQKYGLQVDHIVPLVSDSVCGLHVWHNLQLLEPSLNKAKRNRHWPDMPEEVYDIHRTAA